MSTPRLVNIGRLLCLIGAGLGALGLLGWATGIGALTTLVPGEPPIRPNSAVALVAVGVAGALLGPSDGRGWRRTVARLAGVIALLQGVAVVAKYAVGVDLYIDHLLFRDEALRYPGWGSPVSALAFAFLGGALLVYDVRPRGRVRPSEWLAFVAALLGFTALVRQLLSTGVPYGLTSGPFVGAAVPSGVGLLLVAVGLLLERPDVGGMRLVTAPGPASALLRQLAFVVCLTPVVLGLIVTRAFHALGIEDFALAVATLSASMAGISVLLLYIAAVSFNRAQAALHRSAAQLSASEERYRLTFEEAPIGMTVVTLDGHFLRVNNAYCQIVGRTAEELLKLRFQDITHPDDRDADVAVGGRLVAGEIPRYQFEKRYIRKDGTVVRGMLSVSVLRNADGTVAGYIGQLEDITERKRAEAALRESEARFSGIISISADAIISIDDQHRITVFNDGAERTFGYARSEVLGQSLDVLIPERFHEAHRKDIAGFVAGPTSSRRVGERTEILGRRKNGEEFPAEASISKLEVGGSLVLTVALRDVTERRRLELELQRAIRARDDVLGIVAHDLRNPLGTLLLQAELIRRGEGQADTARLARGIVRATQRMNRLVQDLLDVTCIEAGELSVTRVPVPPAEFVSEATEAETARTSHASIELVVDLPGSLPELWCDRDRMLQVFENLIGNAIRYTTAGGRVIVGAASRGSDVLFWVSDTGIGISPEHQEHLFDRFYRVRKGERHGAGLGLTIVKGIIEAHGGRVWVDSAPGRGSTFFFSIPVLPRLEQHAVRA